MYTRLHVWDWNLIETFSKDLQAALSTKPRTATDLRYPAAKTWKTYLPVMDEKVKGITDENDLSNPLYLMKRLL